MPPGEPEPVPRRLEAGDWVVAAPHVRSLPGVGKLVEGDYDPADDALLRARVEWTHGAFWLPVGDLVRVEPEGERALARAALERRVVGPERLARLRALLDGRRPFVRSPGLLDLLWAGLAEEDRPRGLVQLLDEGAALARAARPPLFAPLEPAGPRGPIARDAPAPEGVLGLVLGALDETPLRALLAQHGLDLDPAADARLLRTQARALGLASILVGVKEPCLRRAARAVGVFDDPWSEDELRGAILELARPDAARPAPATWTPLELIERLPATALERALLARGVTPGRGHAQLAVEAARTGLTAAQLLAPALYGELREVVQAWRLTVQSEEPDALRAAILSAVAAPAPRSVPPPAPSPRQVAPDEVLPGILAALDAAALGRLLRALGDLPSRADAPSLREQVRELELPLRSLLAVLGGADLAAVGAAFGLDGAGDAIRTRLAALATPGASHTL